MVWPKFRHLRSPCSVSSASTTSALASTARAMISSTWLRQSSFSKRARISGSQIRPIFSASARPLTKWRSGSEAKASASRNTARGWWKAPTMFLTPQKLMAVLPPTEESIWERVVVGRFTKSMPRM